MAPFIMTCVTATIFGPIQDFLADSHRKRVYLPLNRLQPPTSKNDNSLVLAKTPTVRLLVNDVGGHSLAMELIADELTNYPNNTPNTTELAEAVYVKLKGHYSEVISVLQGNIFPVVQCVLSRKQIWIQDLVPLRWEQVMASGLIWFERSEVMQG